MPGDGAGNPRRSSTYARAQRGADDGVSVKDEASEAIRGLLDHGALASGQDRPERYAVMELRLFHLRASGARSSVAAFTAALNVLYLQVNQPVSTRSTRGLEYVKQRFVPAWRDTEKLPAPNEPVPKIHMGLPLAS